MSWQTKVLGTFFDKESLKFPPGLDAAKHLLPTGFRIDRFVRNLQLLNSANERIGAVLYFLHS